MSETPASVASPALRLTRGMAIAWILVNAASPMFYALGWTALNKEVRPSDALAVWLPVALGWLAVFALPAPLLLLAMVLRRAAPALRWWHLVPALFMAWALGLAADMAGGNLGAAQGPFRSGVRPLADFSWQELLGLPWLSVAALAGTVAAFSMLLPAWVFAHAARVRLALPVLAVACASIVTALISAGWLLAGVDWDLLHRSAMNGWTMPKRLSALLVQGSAQAIWAIVALLVFAWRAAAFQDAERPAPLRALVAWALILALLVPGAAALLASGGWGRLELAVQRALSPPPARDSSEGEPLLAYAFTAQVRVRAIPRKAALSPDGRWIVAVAHDRHVVVVDAATGALAHRFPDGMGVYDSPDWAWSPDSRRLALRTQGDAVPGKYVRHQSRLRVYAAPGFAQVGEYRHTGAPCLSETHIESAVMFEPDGESLWLACGLATQATATDLLALRFALPQLALQAERRYGEAAPWHLRGLKQVGGSIWAWHTDLRAPYARFRDLGKDRVPAVLQPPPGDRAPQPEWTLQDVVFDEVKATLRFHAWAERRQRLVVHDMRTGAVVSRTEGALPATGAPYVIALAAGGLRIESHAQPTSRAGELVVVDAMSGRVRQRIRTHAQHPLSASADGRVVVTQAGSELRVYRIQPASGP
jgi:hypothetical protein